jgi:cellulose synthase/poly-beta-1,6-N-acetylglucosamine synthase-like glycosyltransferase
MQKTEEAGVQAPVARHFFSVGICATGEAPGLPSLVASILSEAPAGFSLRKVVVVASDCSPGTVAEARSLAIREPRLHLIEHEVREGKASAINEIMSEAEGDFLLFVNADAVPDPRSVSKVLRCIGRDRRLGIVSGRPVFEARTGLTSLVLDMMWTAHNINSSRLTQRGQGNHGTDELMVIRSELIDELPEGVVNDGAYISGRVKELGYRVGFEPDATVRIDVPTRMIDLVRQRRRILYGHIQVKNLVGRAPMTVETLMFFRPSEGFRILVRTLAGRPRLLLALPAAVVGEMLALGGALFDAVTSSNSHAVWRRYAD